MPGPVYVPGAKNTSVPGPPKPVARPRTHPAPQATGPLVTIPTEPLRAWRSLWHELGSNLPWYVNNSRASRRELRALARTHG